MNTSSTTSSPLTPAGLALRTFRDSALAALILLLIFSVPILYVFLSGGRGALLLTVLPIILCIALVAGLLRALPVLSRSRNAARAAGLSPDAVNFRDPEWLTDGRNLLHLCRLNRETPILAEFIPGRGKHPDHWRVTLPLTTGEQLPMTFRDDAIGDLMEFTRRWDLYLQLNRDGQVTRYHGRDQLS